MNRHALAAAGASLAAAAILSACGGAAAKPDVVLVVVDSLSAAVPAGPDGSASVTPEVDELAASGLSFRRAVAPASWNLPSVSSLVTSVPPWVHGQGSAGAGTEHTTLAEVLGRDGYRTAAFTEVAWPLLQQGFDSFINTAGDDLFGDPGDNSAKGTVDAAIEWLRRGDGQKPSFLLVHTYEAHGYFLGKPAHHELARRENPGYEGPFREWAIRDLSRPAAEQVTEALLAASPEDLAYVRSLYRGAVAEADREVGRLVAAVRARNRPAVVVVTSSNGEGFRPDLRRVHHGGRLHDDLLHVPLVVSWPGHLDAGVVTDPVSSLDVPPTVLALAGLPPEPAFTGAALVRPEEGLLAGLRGRRFHVRVPADRTLIAEEAAFQVLADGKRAPAAGPRYALYLGLVTLVESGDGALLYDLKTDPRQERDLATERPEVAQALRDQLHQAVDRAGRSAAGPDSDQLEQLRSLGYVQ